MEQQIENEIGVPLIVPDAPSRSLGHKVLNRLKVGLAAGKKATRFIFI
jgi:hypothetical protein